MKILFIETFYGGSHKSFADQWISRSIHSFQLITLPPRFWKWRQAGSALFLADSIPELETGEYDAMVVSGMIDLAHLRALRPDMPPVLLYIHENQFTYPLQRGEKRDFRYGFTDLVNILCAENPVFNSRYNQDVFFNECRKLLHKLPDALPLGSVQKAFDKSVVIYPGINYQKITDVYDDIPEPDSRGQFPPLIIWNHRHEHDKDPQTAFRILENLHNKGLSFRLALLGERFKKSPEAFERARRVLSEKIVADAYLPAREYYSWLRRGDIVISTATQENFGISVVEAVSAGCWPLLPRRLAYPEVMPLWARDACLWNSEKQLEKKLEGLLKKNRKQREKLTKPLSAWMKRYSWEKQIVKLDKMIEETARSIRQ